jgi:pentatricopeptide repeat protein
MKSEGLYPDAFTFSCGLKACCMTSTGNMGEALHDELNRKGLGGSDLVIGNTLVKMYTKSGSLEDAQTVFDQLPACDVITWNVLIAGYSEHGHSEESLRYFEQMQLKGLCANAITYACVLRGCGDIGASNKGLEIHVEIVKKGLLEREPMTGNSLLDMYAKCGLLSSAEQMFDSLAVHDLASWNSLAAGYSQLGETGKLIRFFKRMVSDGVRPDQITFLILLGACSRTGLFDISQTYFEAMNEHYGIIPSLKHQTCVVDLLGRVGELELAIGMIKRIPFYPNLAIWHMVLDACRNGGNLELGKQAFEHAVCLDENDAGAYVLMTQIYTGG